MSATGALALKLVLTPVLIGAASLAGRRWGSAVGGWLIGIPFTSGPIAFFLALDPGPSFAAAAAAGIMAGAASQAAFCLAYSWTAQRERWLPSLVSAAAGFGVATLLLDTFVVPPIGTFALVIVVLVVSLFLMPRGSGPRVEPVRFPAWDIPARIAVATAFVVALTAAAPLLGPRLAGLLAPFPLYGALLAAFAHRLEGSAAAVEVLRGLLLGLFAFGSFFLVLALLLTTEIAIAFGAAIVAGLVVHGGSLLVGRRLGLA
ncbi:MAG TPA: hypothetical protein VJQ08_09630 [Candidatus Dormibacteraeota bacterium]|nr:hypothetical protein [Candidatus Dormibacteraeota bacterium]